MNNSFVNSMRTRMSPQQVDYYSRTNWAFGRGGFHRYAPSKGLGDDPTTWNGFSALWQQVKSLPDAWVSLGSWISMKQQKLGVLYAAMVQSGDTDSANVLQDEIDATNKDLQTWWTVKGYFDKYWPEWARQAQAPSQLVNTDLIVNNLPGISGLGIVPAIILGVASLAALAYVSTEGFNLYLRYKNSDSVISAIKEKVDQKQLSSQVLVDIAKAAATTNTDTSLGRGIESFGTMIGIGLIALLGLKIAKVI